MKAIAGHRVRRGIVLILLQALVGCLGEGTRADRGRDEGSRSPERIVSLVPAVTEILLELGARGRLVARTNADPSPALAGLPSVGELLTPNLEELVASDPDLVIAWPGLDLSALERAMAGEGRVRSLSIDRLADIGPSITDVGRWIGEDEAADALKHRVIESLRAADRRGADAERPSVLWVLSSEPTVGAGPRTFIGDIIDLVGGRNAAGSARDSWPQLGQEALVSLDPDVLVWSEGPGMFREEQLRHRMPWSRLSSVTSNHVITVEGARFHVPGPNIASAALDLARSLAELDRQ